MTNFTGPMMMPRPGPDGKLAITNFIRPDAEITLIDIAHDSGKFVGAILADPEKYAGANFCGATRLYRVDEIAQIMSKTLGKDIKYNQIPRDVYGSFLPEAMRDVVLNMLSYQEEYGYYGPDTAKRVEWAVENALSKPTEFEDFLKEEQPEL